MSPVLAFLLQQLFKPYKSKYTLILSQYLFPASAAQERKQEQKQNPAAANQEKSVHPQQQISARLV